MKIGITADVHLSPAHPERIENLKNLLNNLLQKKIYNLIIAGDLFEQENLNESIKVFINLLEEFNNINTYIIPGNHDSKILSKFFPSLPNLKFFSKPQIVKLSNIPFLFIPYFDNTSMGEIIAEFKQNLPPENWILISHGDYMGLKQRFTGNEADAYFPLSREDISQYKPQFVFLGHIHQHWSDNDKVYYPGSPYPVDKTETGIRYILLFDIKKKEPSYIPIETDKIYLKEKINIIPVSNIEKYLNEKLEKLKRKWQNQGLSEEILKKTYLTVELNGFTDNRAKVIEFINNLKNIFQLKDVKFVDNLQIAEMPELKEFTERFIRMVEQLEYTPSAEYMPDKELILLEGEKIIYTK